MFFRSIIISYFLLLISHFGYSQFDSCHLRISMLTCSPGEELYSTFGHSALRVTDSVTNEDIVYNYGTFDFDEPGFYTKFIRGKLLYYLSTDDFNNFKQSFQQENRGMIEQVLDLSCNEKQKMVQLLHQNLLNENKFYKYDFLFDNCTTRLRDLLKKSVDTPVRFLPVVDKPATYRQFIFEYMDYNDNQWTKLGMDILLGNNTDKVMSTEQTMFLPDYLMRGFDKGYIGRKPIVAAKQNVLNSPVTKKETRFFTHPLFIFTMLLLLFVIMSFSKKIFIQNILYGLDGFLFFMAGLTGCLILFMWFCTDHMVCRDNYNLLWAWPTHAVAAFLIHSKKLWAKKYFLISAMANLIVLIAWFFLPQHMSPSLIPIILILLFRSLWYYFENTNGRQIRSHKK